MGLNLGCPLMGALLCTALSLTACGDDSIDRSAVAAAKCALPVAQKAGFPDDTSPQTDGVEVEDLKKGRYRVTGRSIIVGDETRAVDFVCDVAPDDSDKLRGFKVTHLEVTPVG